MSLPVMGLLRLPIQRVDANVLKVVPGASVLVYKTLNNGTSPVSDDGIISPGAILATLYSDKNGLVSLGNPVIADEKGIVSFYAPTDNYHLAITAPDGQLFGISWVGHLGDPENLGPTVSLDSFGAVGDASFDDGPAILAAHDALPATGGKIILSYGKHYRHAVQLMLTKRIQFEGPMGHESEAVTPPCSLIKASTLHDTGIVFAGSCSGMKGVAYTGEGGNTGDGIQIRARSVTLRDVFVSGMGGNGIRIGDPSVSFNCNIPHLYNVSSRANGGDGIYMHSDDSNVDPKSNAGTLIGVECNNNGGHGLHMGNTNTHAIIGFHAESNVGWGIYLEKRAQLNVFLGGDIEVNTAGGINVADALAVDNIFVIPNYQSFSDTPNARTIRFDKTVLNMPHGLGEILTNGGITGHNPNLSGSNQQYMTLWDAAAERIRLGWTAIAPATGLVPAQILADGTTLYLASRDTASGKVKIMAQTGLAFYILLDPQNSKVEITENIILTGAHGAMIQFPEQSDPSAGPANTGRLYVRDNGAGKSQLCVRFPTGAIQVIATEP